MYLRLSLVFFVLTGLLGGCGFQLRGGADSAAGLPAAWQQMYLLTGNPNDEFSRGVQARFTAQGVQWRNRGDANYTLVLRGEQFKQRNLSLNSEARAAELELTMQSQFLVRDATNTEVIPPTDVVVVRQMENDPRNVVGKDEEIRILKSEMRADLAEQIVRRVSFFANNGP